MSDELRDEYAFDYAQAKPNRFALRIRAFRHFTQRAKRHWFSSGWGIRIGLAMFYLVFFHVGYVCVYSFHLTARASEFAYFWNEPNILGMSVLLTATTIHLSWAAMLAIEAVQCIRNRSEPFRYQRIAVYSLLILLLIVYIISIRYYATAFGEVEA